MIPMATATGERVHRCFQGSEKVTAGHSSEKRLTKDKVRQHICRFQPGVKNESVSRVITRSGLGRDRTEVLDRQRNNKAMTSSHWTEIAGLRKRGRNSRISVSSSYMLRRIRDKRGSPVLFKKIPFPQGPWVLVNGGRL